MSVMRQAASALETPQRAEYGPRTKTLQDRHKKWRKGGVKGVEKMLVCGFGDFAWSKARSVTRMANEGNLYKSISWSSASRLWVTGH